MRKKISFELEIPEGVSCKYLEDVLECSKGENKVNRKIFIPKTELKIEESKVILFCEKANRKNIAIMKTNLSHIKNIFKGLEEKFIYELEICNVHFPMNCKLEGKNLIINNFLGEKIPRKAKILEEYLIVLYKSSPSILLKKIILLSFLVNFLDEKSNMLNSLLKISEFESFSISLVKIT